VGGLSAREQQGRRGRGRNRRRAGPWRGDGGVWRRGRWCIWSGSYEYPWRVWINGGNVWRCAATGAAAADGLWGKCGCGWFWHGGEAGGGVRDYDAWRGFWYLEHRGHVVVWTDTWYQWVRWLWLEWSWGVGGLWCDAAAAAAAGCAESESVWSSGGGRGVSIWPAGRCVDGRARRGARRGRFDTFRAAGGWRRGLWRQNTESGDGRFRGVRNDYASAFCVWHAGNKFRGFGAAAAAAEARGRVWWVWDHDDNAGKYAWRRRRRVGRSRRLRGKFVCHTGPCFWRGIQWVWWRDACTVHPWGVSFWAVLIWQGPGTCDTCAVRFWWVWRCGWDQCVWEYRRGGSLAIRAVDDHPWGRGTGFFLFELRWCWRRRRRRRCRRRRSARFSPWHA